MLQEMFMLLAFMAKYAIHSTAIILSTEISMLAFKFSFTMTLTSEDQIEEIHSVDTKVIGVLFQPDVCQLL